MDVPLGRLGGKGLRDIAGIVDSFDPSYLRARRIAAVQPQGCRP